jgi:hypothetical protein
MHEAGWVSGSFWTTRKNLTPLGIFLSLSLYLYPTSFSWLSWLLLFFPPYCATHITQTFMFPAGFFVFSFTLFVLHPYLFLCLGYPVFYLLPLLKHTTQTFMPPAGFKPAIPASDRPQTLALDRSPTGIGNSVPGQSTPYRPSVPTELSRPPILYQEGIRI